MKKSNNQENAFKNPPLRIFSTIGADEGSVSIDGANHFHRPKLKRNVNHDRISQYFGKRNFTLASRLD